MFKKNRAKTVVAIILAVLMICQTLPVFAAGQSAGDNYKGHWAERSIDLLLAEKIIIGDEYGNINPNDLITRAEFVTIINRALGYKTESNTNFPDVAWGKWYYSEFAKAKQAGIIKGDDKGNANPNAYITRAEVAVALAAALKMQTNKTATTFTDNAVIPSWALAGIISMQDNKLIDGYPDGSFKARNNITRAECFTIIAHAIEKTLIYIGSGIITEVKSNDSDSGSSEVYYEKSFGEIAYKYFCDVSAIPRGSDNEKEISDFLVAFAKEYGFEAIQDEFRNVLIRKPGSKGRETESPIILQGHMDMVCVKDSDVDHDFLKDPIVPIIEDGWIKANGTSLGADNGCGIAMIMAVLAASNLSHPPIEAVITANEEGGNGPGAFGFDTSLLQGRQFINLDSEEEGVLTASCAGSAWSDVIITLKNETAPSGIASYELKITGLLGGHSGIDIEKGRANAIILMAHLLKALDKEDIYLSNIEGGEFWNEITRECVALISFAESDLDKIKSIIAEMESKFKEDFPDDEDLIITLEKTDTCESVISHDSLQNIIDCILETPNGVQSMSPTFEGLVQTSNNTGVIFTLRNSEFFPSDVVVMFNLLRSSVEEEIMDLLTKIAQLGEKPGVMVDSPLDYPDWIFMPWEYREDSPLRDKMISVFEDTFDYCPTVEGTHGGLECALFAARMPDCDFISMGPTVENVHSTRERMSLSSFNRTCIYLINILESL
ncbi:MAG: beta-Ala-His dipeptidase [Clostridiales bacterium]|nr:beta-Ala-His dipeptidase [Clostridiales bacterium]